MKKAFIFDMDGTIVPNIAFHHEAWLMFLRKHNIAILPADFATQNHGTAAEMITRFFGNHLSALEIQQLGSEKELMYRTLYQSHIQEVKGLTALLGLARDAGIKLGLPTMGNEENISFILDNLRITPFFNVIIGGHQVKQGKPHPEIYQTLLAQLGLSARDVVAFEDSYGGVKSAQAADIAVVGVCTSHTEAAFQLWGVAECIRTFEEYAARHFAS